MFHARYISSMEQTPPPRLARDRHATARAFGVWLRERMIDRGYNLTARGGGQKKLAGETGLSEATISRFLKGDVLSPDPESLRLIADALRLNFPLVLIQSGLIAAKELTGTEGLAGQIGRPPITPEQAAAELGITNPQAVAAFVAAATALQPKRPGTTERAE